MLCESLGNFADVSILLTKIWKFTKFAILIGNLRNSVETIIMSLFMSEQISFMMLVKILLILTNLKIFMLYKPNGF